MIDTVVYRSSHDRARERKRYIPTIETHLRDRTGSKVAHSTSGHGSRDGIKVRLLPDQPDNELVIKVSEAGTWHTFAIPTEHPREFGEAFEAWCRAEIHHAQINWQ